MRWDLMRLMRLNAINEIKLDEMRLNEIKWNLMRLIRLMILMRLNKFNEIKWD
jgi:hypothetical protein